MTRTLFWLAALLAVGGQIAVLRSTLRTDMHTTASGWRSADAKWAVLLLAALVTVLFLTWQSRIAGVASQSGALA